MVQLGYVEHISPERVRTTLNKMRLLSWRKPIVVLPESEAGGEFVYHVEDVLDVYCGPYDPAVPRVCMDKMDKKRSVAGEASMCSSPHDALAQTALPTASI
jgi:hypothetical protein